jgi:hypothetical protein
MTPLHVDLKCVILGFLSLDDFFQFSLTCRKNVSQRAKLYLALKLPRNCQAKLESILETECGFDYDEFREAMLKSGAVISGSIFLEMLLSDFKAGDIDIWVKDVRDEWSPIEQLVFGCSTQGLDGIHPTASRNMALTRAQGLEVGKRCWNSLLAKDREISHSLTSYIPLGSPTSFITQVYKYICCQRQIEIIRLCSEESAAEFVSNTFDFSVCCSFSDGSVTQLKHVADVCRRELHLLPNNRNDRNQEERITKYLSRGFKLCDDEPAKKRQKH